ncbi:hypothetical protein BDF14DRAFT_6739 [Spinellus fusiger]|nr:hypothetical protein BDF14DRAFT_6739 [Spinellus fusiger]
MVWDAQWIRDFRRTEKEVPTTMTNERDRGYVSTRYRSKTREELRNRNKQNRTKERTKPDLYDCLKGRASKGSTQKRNNRSSMILLRSQRSCLNTFLLAYYTPSCLLFANSPISTI